MTNIDADFIIIGAGSAGCVLAARLSADGKSKVLLLEAGNDDRPFKQLSQFWPNTLIHLPIGYSRTMMDKRVAWTYQTEPDAGTQGRQHYWPRGKVLGGSSSLNAMLYVRGQAADYDGWKEQGCDGWGWEDVLPYFKKSENQERGPSDLHGVGGPLRVQDVTPHNEISKALIEATVEAGVPRSNDINTAEQEGASWFQVTQTNGRRCSTAVAYLRPALSRQNLRVITGAVTERIIFEGTRAVGVAFKRNDSSVTASARREVIVCAGAINSPQLLQLSGLGPQRLLRDHGITPIADMPGVGGNLQDHLLGQLCYRLKPGSPSVNRLSHGAKFVGQMMRYAFARNGLLAFPAADVGIFCRSSPGLNRPDIQFHALPASIDLEKYAKTGKLNLEALPGLTLAPNQLRPKSRGRVDIRSADPTEPPAMSPNYLSHVIDQQVMVAGLRLGRKFVEQPSIAPYIEHEILPGVKVQTDEELLDFARATAVTGYHPSGTCAMGVGAHAVVDPQLRVHGIANLRVVDASIMPRITSGNTNAPTIMIAEKAADMILRA